VTTAARPGSGAIRIRHAIGWYSATVATVVVLVFYLPRAMPGDPVANLGGAGGGANLTDPKIHAQLQAYYGLNRPLVAQFWRYLAQLCRGHLGFSYSQHAPVSHLIASRLPWTMLLMGSALLLATIVTYLAGVNAGWRRGGRSDLILTSVSLGASAIPPFASATLLLLGFAVVWPLFPLAGARTPFAHLSALGSVTDVARHLVLPVAALTVTLVGRNVLLVRNSIVSALGQDYLVLARAKGLPNRVIKHRHAGRNALLPFLTAIGVELGFAIGGSIFVESAFGYPGMGTLILQAVQDRDYPVLDASLLVLAAAVLTVNLVVDLLYRRLDPGAGSG
jgi:peptide/nickel transport system permease protein